MRFMAARALFVTVLVSLCTLACSGGKREVPPDRGAGFDLPALSAPEIIARASALADSGYGLMEAGQFEAAIAVMKESAAALPEARGAHYNLACAYARSGDVTRALQELALAVNAGWDDHRHISTDPDLASLREAPPFREMLEEVKRNREHGLAPLAEGLPEVAEPDRFTNAESLKAWMQAEIERTEGGSRHLFAWQATRLQSALLARGLAARRVLAEPDSSFDEGLERVRAMGGLLGSWQPWGPVADGTVKEVKAYLAQNPAAAGRDEALYWAGLAEYCRAQPESGDPGWAGSVSAARAWFAQIPAGSRVEGVAAAWQLMFDLREAGDDTSPLMPRLRDFATKYGDDQAAMGVASNYFADDLIRAEWPIAFEAVDLAGRRVTLEEYRGNPVLLCYWATW